MTTLTFNVSGSSDADYVVRFERKGSALLAFCTCQAGQNSQFCKHRIAILDGDVSNVTSSNASEASSLKDMLSDTPLAQALAELAVAVAQQEEATTKLKQAKKLVSKCMHSEK